MLTWSMIFFRFLKCFFLTGHKCPKITFFPLCVKKIVPEFGLWPIGKSP